jgi:hypothetical protein
MAQMDGSSMDPSAIQGAITGTVLNAVSVDGRIATSDRAIPLRVSSGADPVQYQGGSLASSIEYSAGALRPHQAITFTASGQPPGVGETRQAEGTKAGATQYEWLFGDGTGAIGPRVRHAFPDGAGTLQDGSGRFRVLLKTTDPAGHSTWTERPVVVASSPVPALAPSSPLLPGLREAVSLEPGLLEARLLEPVSVELGLRPKSERGDGAGDVLPREVSATHLSDALAVAPVGATLHFTGYLDVPSDGGYTLSVLASGHTTLAIDGRILASGPKERSLVCGTLGYATQAAVGSLVMRKGLHRFELSAERPPGASMLVLKWEGPGILRSDIPEAAFKHTPTPAQP